MLFIFKRYNILSSNFMSVKFMSGHLVQQFHVCQIYVRHF